MKPITIPVIVFTTSTADEDIARSYDLRTSSYVRTPVTFEGPVEPVRSLGSYWFAIIELPPAADRRT